MEQNLQVPLSTLMEQETKFCKDCKHCVKDTSPAFWKCARTRAVSFVDGTVTYNYCSDERRVGAFTCLPSARFFMDTYYNG